jgi:hypothetical protein
MSDARAKAARRRDPDAPPAKASVRSFPKLDFMESFKLQMRRA